MNTVRGLIFLTLSALTNATYSLQVRSANWSVVLFYKRKKRNWRLE